MIKFLLSDKFILPVVYIIIGVIIYNVIKVIIKKISKSRFADKKKVTIISLIRNIIKYLIMIFIALAILNVYGVNTSGVIASIGVAGVIIGLAFQDIVSDLLAGMFILFDNQFAIGDIVTIDGFKGEVIGLGLMSTKIKAASGDVKILPNSSFRTVINHSMNDTALFINLDVAYTTNIEKLEKVLKEMEEEVLKINGVVGNYQLLGINEFSTSSIKYLVSFKAKYNTQLQAKRDFNMLIRKHFEKNNIEIPYSKVDVYIRGNNE